MKIVRIEITSKFYELVGFEIISRCLRRLPVLEKCLWLVVNLGAPKLRMEYA